MQRLMFFILTLIFIMPARFFCRGLMELSIEEISYGIAGLSFSLLYLIVISSILILKSKFILNLNYYQFKIISAITIIHLIQVILFNFYTSYIIDLIAYNIGSILYLITFSIIVEHISYRTFLFCTIINFIGLILLSPVSFALVQLVQLTKRPITIGFGANDIGWISGTLMAFSIFAKIKFRIILYMISFFGILLSGSRRQIIFLLLLFIIYVIKKRDMKIKKNKRLNIGITIMLILCLICIIRIGNYYFTKWMPLLGRIENKNIKKVFYDEYRILYWKAAIENLIKNPFGLGTVADVADKIYNNETMHAHNLILNILNMSGILLGTFYIFIILIPIINIFKLKENAIDRDERRNTIYLLKSYYVSFIYFSCFDFPFVNPKNISIFMLFMATSLKMLKDYSRYKLSRNWMMR